MNTELTAGHIAQLTTDQGARPDPGTHPSAGPDPAPRAATQPTVADDRWPLLAVDVTRTSSHERVCFHVSEIAPAAYVGPIVLGVDLLESRTGSILALVVRFVPGSCTVRTMADGRATEHPDAVVEFLGHTVVVELRLPARWGSGRAAVGFADRRRPAAGRRAGRDRTARR
ncbi:hypothetical protein [Herbiconiux sp.]|uniref:hypothetical protein n=1 Tax=Herbiconiux sp. TaxID=1871186 RepID=UPI0025C27A02|nr:hypothetical protein [Herbiconiux sp.]